MDKQNEGIQDLEGAGDPGRHERLVTVEDFGKTIRPSKRKNEDVLFAVLKIVRNGLIEAASYPENSSLEIYVTRKPFNKPSKIKDFC